MRSGDVELPAELADGFHPAVECAISGADPIVGVRYALQCGKHLDAPEFERVRELRNLCAAGI